jgi:hypothetical protein
MYTMRLKYMNKPVNNANTTAYSESFYLLTTSLSYKTDNSAFKPPVYSWIRIKYALTDLYFTSYNSGNE